MNNLTLDRIMSQVISTPNIQVIEDVQPINSFVPINLQALEEILIRELQLSPVFEPKEAINPDIHFDNIFDFNLWYIQNKNHFSPQQRVALDTLEQVRGMIDTGCACKRSGREVKAHQYFEQFWLNNKDTDILSTISKIAGANKVSINQYCSYTR